MESKTITAGGGCATWASAEPAIGGSHLRLSQKEVEHIALLSRLKLTAQERERMTTQLNDIMGFFEQIGELDTADVEPTSHVIPMRNVFRPDEVRPSLLVDDVLQNAPQRAGDTFRVPRVVE